MSDKSYCKRCGELDSCINDLCHSCAVALACDRFETEMEANADQVFPPPQHVEGEEWRDNIPLIIKDLDDEVILVLDRHGHLELPKAGAETQAAQLLVETVHRHWIELEEGRQPELEAPPGWVVLPYNNAQNLTAIQVSHIVEVCENATDAGKCVVTTVAVGPNKGKRTIVDRPQGDVLFIIAEAQGLRAGQHIWEGVQQQPREPLKVDPYGEPIGDPCPWGCGASIPYLGPDEGPEVRQDECPECKQPIRHHRDLGWVKP